MYRLILFSHMKQYCPFWLQCHSSWSNSLAKVRESQGTLLKKLKPCHWHTLPYIHVTLPDQFSKWIDSTSSRITVMSYLSQSKLRIRAWNYSTKPWFWALRNLQSYFIVFIVVRLLLLHSNWITKSTTCTTNGMTWPSSIKTRFVFKLPSNLVILKEGF